MKKTKNTHFSLILPALILLALIANLWILFGFSTDSSGDFDALDITFITTEDCEECFSLEAFEEYFVQNEVAQDQMKSIDADSLTGKYLVAKYDIIQVPTVIIKGNVASFEFMQGLVDSVAEKREDAYVVNKLQPPYLDLEEDRVVGTYTAIYLDDATCDDCYEVSDHDAVFERLAMNAQETQVIDISSELGQELINSYIISAVPTIILSGELDVYEGLQQIWPSVGTIEEDGTYVLRKGVEQMGTYKLIPENQIVEPTVDTQQAEQQGVQE